MQSVVSQNRSGAPTGRGSQTRKRRGQRVSGRGKLGVGVGPLAGAEGLSACGDPCLPLPGSPGGSERVSDTDALEIEFMDLNGFNGDRCKSGVEVRFVDTNLGLNRSYDHK